ncbi:MAG: type II secretion system F family protein [Candidatus Polarisedimenticolaceae bacterium]|nr:type II secretion system F family protein [Candidatus Polarisedimenticolaceae bacterium]
MAIFKYKGIDLDGKMVRGRLVAVNSADLESRLEQMDLELINSKEVISGGGFISGRKIGRRELINFCIHMEQMIRSGVPILEALGDLRDSLDNPRFKEIVSVIISSIEGGQTFSEALNQFPTVFDEIFVNLVKAGEQSGKLPTVLHDMTETLKWQDELAAQTKKILMYPAFVTCVVVGVTFFLMIYLVPQMVSFIENAGKEIPFHTQLLIMTSDVVINYWYLLVGLPVVGWVTVYYLASVYPRVRYLLDKLLLNTWIVGPILHKIILTRFANYFALLYSSGVTVLDCMKISESIAGNRVISAAIHDVGQQIADGKTISEGFEQVNMFPPLVLRMFKVGENTGSLDEALATISYFYNRDVQESIDKLQSLIEPVMTVVLGLLLGWVMLSVLGPIYDIIGEISG